MRSLCILPARGGSKRIPRKNVRLLGGRPLLMWPLEQAQSAGIFSKIMVSTDDTEIARIAVEAGAEVPFIRSEETSHDHATTTAVVDEVLHYYSQRGERFDLICCLYPTAALVMAEHLRAGYDLLAGDTRLDSCLSVQSYGHPIERALRVDAGRVVPVDSTALGRRTQDLMPAFHDAGQFYWCRPEALAANHSLLGNACAPVQLSAWEAVDLDTEEDWAWLERLFKIRG